MGCYSLGRDGPVNPSRGEVWRVDLHPPVGHEQGGVRPALIVSVDQFNHGAADLVVVLPITKKDKGIASHVRVAPGPTNGLDVVSYIKCEEVRCVSKRRLSKYIGSTDSKTMQEVEYRVAIILGL